MKRILKWTKWCDEGGQALVMVAVAMVALMGFTALVIDGGRLYSEKSKLQKALDSAVLAGAQVIRTSGTDPKAVAAAVAQKNGYSLDVEKELTVIGNTIEATKQSEHYPMTFARVIGIPEATVGAKAKAEIGPLKKGYRIAPIAIAQSSVPTSTELTFDNPGGHHGNAGFLDLNGKGANGLAESIIKGGTFEIGTTVAETKTGLDFGPISKAIQKLIESDADKPQCQSVDSADNSCARVITIVVIKTWEDANGKSDLEVVGLAAYWIDKMQGKQIIGHFIKDIAPGEIGEDTEIGENNLYGVKLIE